MVIKMNLQNNYKTVPEGERVLEIIKAECKPSGKPKALHVVFKDSEGGLINSKYDFDIPGAVTAMSIMCSYALNLEDGDEFDTIKDTPRLIGKKLICEVVHTEGTKVKEDGTLPIFANIKKIIGPYEERNTVEQTTSKSPRQQIIGNDLD